MVVISFVLGVLLTLMGCAIAANFVYHRRLEQANRIQANTIIEQDKVIAELRAAEAKRLTHKTAAALEDLLSSLLNAKRMHDSLQSDADAMNFWLEKAAEFGRGARGECHYDPDQPTGNDGRRA